MREPSLFTVFTRRLDAMGIAYMASGSVAVIVYGAPRLTHDVDLVVAVGHGDAERFVQGFPPEEFYCPPVEVIAEEATRERRGHINLIHQETGFKADLYFHGRDPLHDWGMARARRLDIGGETLVVAPPEYVIVRKLEFYREGGSEKHLRDIRSMLDISSNSISMDELNRLIAAHNLAKEWARAEAFHCP